jgi:glycerol-3-phosphate dehydrogenase (NAD(P)+)
MTQEQAAAGSAKSVAVLGAGSWGTTFAKILADAATASGVERNIRLWGRRSEVVEQINTRHRNPQYLKEIDLPHSITASTEVADVLSGADLVVLAVPAAAASRVAAPDLTGRPGGFPDEGAGAQFGRPDERSHL